MNPLEEGVELVRKDGGVLNPFHVSDDDDNLDSDDEEIIDLIKPSRRGLLAQVRTKQFLAVIALTFALVIVCSIAASFRQATRLSKSDPSPPPHLILVLLDDFGFNDAPWTSTDLSHAMPYLKSLASRSLLLPQFYTQAVCSPSRASFLTGRFPYRYGFQHSVLKLGAAEWLPESEILLPEKLAKAGYMSYMVGKWHIGFAHSSVTPLRRGFDSFFGYYNGAENYTSHSTNQGARLEPPLDFLDLHAQNSSTTDLQIESTSRGEGVHSIDLFADEADRLLRHHHAHDRSSPLFFYYASQAPHAPITPPARFRSTAICRNVSVATRRGYCEMLAACDEAIGESNLLQIPLSHLSPTFVPVLARFIGTLDSLFPMDSRVVVISGDNGGDPMWGGSNWPLKGVKGSLWQGGVRNNAIVHSDKLLPTDQVGSRFEGIVHLVDVHAMFLRLAGLSSPSSSLELDGADFWDDITFPSGQVGRSQLLLNMDSAGATSRVPWGGRGAAALLWVTEHGVMKLCVNCVESTWWDPTEPLELYRRLNFSGSLEDMVFEGTTFNTTDVRLFNLTADPEERRDIATTVPAIVQRMLEALEGLAPSEMPGCNFPDTGTCTVSDNRAREAAIQAGGCWVPWLS